MDKNASLSVVWGGGREGVGADSA